MKTNFLKNYIYEIIVCVMLVWVAGYSLFYLTTKPKLWYDEGVNIEVASNFFRFGVLDMQIAPAVFSGAGYLYQATGYPVTMSLALIFKLFGFSASLARLYMIVWMLIALISIYVMLKKIMGQKEAALTIILVSTFASFFDNGRAVMGEIPGFVFLIWALYLWILKDSYVWTGFFLGLALAAKSSIYISVLPVFVLVLFLRKEKWISRSAKTVLGAMLPILLRIIFAMSNIFSISEWRYVLRLFRNPFGTNVSPYEYALQNLRALPLIPSLAYFSFFMIIILVAWFLFGQKQIANDQYKKLFLFATVYIFFAFLYYLKSPGWIRYLIAVELFIFILMVPALKHLFERRDHGFLLSFVVVILACGQFVYLFNGAKLYYSNAELAVANFANAEFKNKTVGILNIPQIGAFIAPEKKFQTWKMVGVPQLGEDLLSYKPHLDILIMTQGNSDDLSLLLKNNKYYFVKNIGKYNIFALSGFH